MLFSTPELNEREREVIAEIDRLRKELRFMLSEPRRWTGVLARMTVAQSIQGSNSIEGYVISKDDAIAVVEKEEPLESDLAAWVANKGYRDAMTYILQLSDDPHFGFHEGFLRSLHYMMLSYDQQKRPGKWRPGPIFVQQEESGATVYEGPDAESVPALVHELMDRLNGENGDKNAVPAMIRAAMAHLNLVMIHPFSDGNGRMARALQTLIIVRERVLAPEFCSIEEYIGHIRPEYYSVLSKVGTKTWNPGGDAQPFLQFCLKVHLHQAQSLQRRAIRIGQMWIEIEQEIVKKLGLPERVAFALAHTAMGFKVRNAIYRNMAQVKEHLASRDLKLLVDHKLLIPDGEKRGRSYTAGPLIQEIRNKAHQATPTTPLADPFKTEGSSL
jgi:Fic family protein